MGIIKGGYIVGDFHAFLVVGTKGLPRVSPRNADA